MSKQLIENASRGNVFKMDPRDVSVVGVDFGDSAHPLYDPRIELPIDRAMVESIKAIGVRMAVECIVDEEGRVIVVDGRRRVLHTRVANEELKKLGEPARTINVLGAKMNTANMQIAPLVGEHLNNHRFNDSVTTKAEKAARFLARGYSHEDVALSLNVDVVTIKNYEKLLGLAAAVRKAVDENKISVSAAVKLSDLSKEEQAEKLSELGASNKKVTARVVSEATGKTVAPGKKVLKKIVAAAETSELSEDFIRGIRFAMGDLAATSIKGLSAILNGQEAE